MKKIKKNLFLLLILFLQVNLITAQQWSVVQSPSPGETVNLLRSIDGISGSDIWAVGTRDTLVSGNSKYKSLTEHWNGANWEVIPSPNIGSEFNDLYSVKAISSNNVFAASSFCFGCAPSQS